MNSGPVNRRRWFAFSLRTMFVGMTVGAIALGWIAWQASVVRHRQAMLRQIKVTGGVYFTGSIDWLHSPLVSELRPSNGIFDLPFYRRWLGDQSVHFIGFDRQLTQADDAAIEAFPEAYVHGIPQGASSSIEFERDAWRAPRTRSGNEVVSVVF